MMYLVLFDSLFGEVGELPFVTVSGESCIETALNYNICFVCTAIKISADRKVSATSGQADRALY